MKLQMRTAGGGRGPVWPLSEHVPTYLIQKLGVVTFAAESRLRGEEVKLGRIDSGPSGAKLQAIQPLHILPGHNMNSSMTAESYAERYQLEPASNERVEIIFLRHGDTISSPGSKDSVECLFHTSEVQVNSSATEQVQDDAFAKASGIEDAPEDETEDEATLDETVTEVPVTQTVTQPSKSQPSGTPHLPKEKSLVVHETPTTSRMLGVGDYNMDALNEDRMPQRSAQDTMAVTETFSTARTGHSPTSIVRESTDGGSATERRRPHRSPKVRVNGGQARKHSSVDPSPESDDEQAAEDRSAKRVKRVEPTKSEDGGVQDASPLDVINADPSRTTYSTKRNSRSRVGYDTTPSKSSRSSQRSGTATTAAAYEGEPPRVAFSNSAISEKSSTAKFLRKKGGAFLSTVDDKCNVLCVRDGGLAKTMKVFQAIALGIPIVTDTWLQDSAKAEAFLDLSSYKPTVVQQETEWGFSLEKVWGTAQTPFKGFSIYFTPALRKTYSNFREMERVCKTVGAEVTNKRSSKSQTTIVLATEDDAEVEKMIEEGEACYHKDLVTTSILRGHLDLDGNEFRIGAKNAAPARRKGPRKST